MAASYQALATLEERNAVVMDLIARIPEIVAGF
jgi:hypothetical protein